MARTLVLLSVVPLESVLTDPGDVRNVRIDTSIRTSQGKHTLKRSIFSCREAEDERRRRRYPLLVLVPPKVPPGILGPVEEEGDHPVAGPGQCRQDDVAA